METVVFVLAGAMVLAGALGVVLRANPVHCALSLIVTLFGIAVLFIAQDANFLAAVQVIVYAGAIVVLFLFVIMFLGVDRADDLRVEPLGGQRIAAAVVGIGVVALVIAALASTGFEATGITSSVGPLADSDTYDISTLSDALFTKYVFAFELTSVLLVIAVVGAVVLARRSRRVDEIVDPGQEERAAQIAERIHRAEVRAHVYDDQAEVEAPDEEPEAEDEEVRA
jgi:NADH-quinone oxidoreductase subunit J